ncbi:hypothetical protein ACFL4W_01380 [Planctomycetota bacterium]
MAHTSLFEKTASLGKETPLTAKFKRRTRNSLPATMVMMRKVGRRLSRVFYDVEIVKFDRSTVTITWNYCPLCFGYGEDLVHPECIFKPFDSHVEGSRELNLHITVPISEREFGLRGKVGHVTRTDNFEMIHIDLLHIEDQARDYLKAFFH